MTLREFCKLEILCKDDPIHLVHSEGSFVDILDFDNECLVGNVEKYLKAEILDTEIAYVTPSGYSGKAFVVCLKDKEDN